MIGRWSDVSADTHIRELAGTYTSMPASAITTGSRGNSCAAAIASSSNLVDKGGALILDKERRGYVHDTIGACTAPFISGKCWKNNVLIQEDVEDI